MKIEELFVPFEDKVSQYLTEKGNGHIEFSGKTYQVQIFDATSGEEVWPFLQFNKRGVLKDCFCDCEYIEEHSGDLPVCEHIATAYQLIFNGHNEPLHVRFEASLWNQMCRIYFEKHGGDTRDIAKSDDGAFEWWSTTGKRLFSIKARNEKGRKRLQDILEERPIETEETSLKFSDLSQDEIALWREGRPPEHLRYELSFWSDIAKGLMANQEKGEGYDITFEYDEMGIPTKVFIYFEDVEVSFYIPRVFINDIIPTLAMVNSPLAVYNFNEEALHSIEFDKESCSLTIKVHQEYLAEHEEICRSIEDVGEEDIDLGEWFLVPGKGFYFKGKHTLLAASCIPREAVVEVLEEHLHIIKRHLVNAKIHEEYAEVKYTIAFDEEWNLRLKGYLFDEGDLHSRHSYFMGRWAYLDGEGFYRVGKTEFDGIDIVIPRAEVSDFIHHNKSWMRGHEGLDIHLSSLEDYLNYDVGKNSGLSFHSKVTLSGEEVEGIPFGDWMYIAGNGFYPKKEHVQGMPVHDGVVVPPEEIPSFIRLNREDLRYVKGFFSEQSPVYKAGLHILINDEDIIEVTPIHEYLKVYINRDVTFFGDFTYVAREGFHELPHDMRLPEEFQRKVVIPKMRTYLFVKYELEHIRKHALIIDKRLQKTTDASFVIHKAKGGVDLEDRGLLTFKMYYETKFGSVAVTKIWDTAVQNRMYMLTDAGLILLSDERLQWVKQLPPSRILPAQDSIQVSVLEFMRLMALDNLEESHHLDNASMKVLHRIRDLAVDTPLDFTGFNSTLRSYQDVGVRWLWFLYNHHLSGLLCDDMGLGKTHQAMALMAAAKNKQRGDKKKYFLVVCPTSVIYHWKEKIEEFAPGLRVLVFHGMTRSMDGFLVDYDVLLTSYGVLRVEKDIMSLIHFDVAIFDEIQVAKNHTSKVYKALCQIHSRSRIGLTGTPIENQLRELKSLFDIVLPTYMPSEKRYKEIFITPIEKGKDKKQRDRLSRFIKPFLIRRRKEDVLDDLPDKTEEVAHCGLVAEQIKIYQETLKGSRDQLVADLKDGETSVPYMHVFALLMKLKQVCDHPALFLNDIENYEKYSSGKWDLFVELLQQAQASSQKVVIFSHYIGMLDIIEKHLRNKGIGYASLRGTTVKRGEEIQRFQKDPECMVFVASLMAGGLGIDLTAASVVIHYDRWWNAARENQATDRVHRIGQHRGVQVFKLVTLGTLEEKIDAIIRKKGRLMEDVVGTDDHNTIKTLDRDELIELLQYVDTKEKTFEDVL
jgi:superfamily II DNA or RNA helicase